mgnify:CR=1 FL=1
MFGVIVTCVHNIDSVNSGKNQMTTLRGCFDFDGRHVTKRGGWVQRGREAILQPLS